MGEGSFLLMCGRLGGRVMLDFFRRGGNCRFCLLRLLGWLFVGWFGCLLAVALGVGRGELVENLGKIFVLLLLLTGNKCVRATKTSIFSENLKKTIT